MPDLARVSGRVSSTEEVIAVIERDGGIIIEDFLQPATLEGLRSDLLPLLERQSTGQDAFFGTRTRRLSRLFERTRHCAEIVLHPLYLPVARHFIGKPFKLWAGDVQREAAADVQVGVTQAIQVGPGQEAQPLHRDDGAFLWNARAMGREARLQIMVAVTDFTDANGGTLVIPGSHKWDADRAPSMSEAIPTEMSAGSALIWLGSLFHGAGTNRTEGEYRTGLTMALDASCVRQEENMYLSLSPDTVASYPEEVQRLLGWSTSGRSLGWVEVDGHQRDPQFLLAGRG